MIKKIVWISSYLPRSCGIAYYSSDYIEALKKYAEKKNKKSIGLEPEVFFKPQIWKNRLKVRDIKPNLSNEKISIKIIAHTDASKADYPIINLKNKKWHYDVLKVIKKERPDVVHIQHEYGLYETYDDKNERVIELIRMIKQEQIPVIMTYHSVYKKLTKPFALFMKKTLKELNAGILHCDYQKKALKENIGWTPKNVYVLPHGSKENLKINKENVKKEFGYKKGELIVGSAGIADERKGFRTLIKQFPKVLKKIPNAILVLEMKPHKSNSTRLYIDKVLEEILKSNINKNIEFVVKDYSKEEFYKRLASFDVLVLAYKSESQSGVLAHGFAVGVPAVVTDIEGLGAEIRNSKSGIAVKNRKNFYKSIIKILSSQDLRDRFSKNALNYVKKVNGWSIIARKTFYIYQKIYNHGRKEI